MSLLLQLTTQQTPRAGIEYIGIRATAHLFCRSEGNLHFIKMCTEDWEGKGPHCDVVMYTKAHTIFKLHCPGLSHRWLFGTWSGWSLEEASEAQISWSALS